MQLAGVVDIGSWVPSRSFHVDVLGLSLLESVGRDIQCLASSGCGDGEGWTLPNRWLFEGRCVLTGKKQGQQRSAGIRQKRKEA